MTEKNQSFIFFIAVCLILAFAIHLSLSFETSDDMRDNSIIPKHRAKRYLLFQNNSRILFRVNIKDNIIKVNQIFAHAYGFRANIDILAPTLPHRYVHRTKRSYIYQTIEQMMTQQGFDGKACIYKMFCDAVKETDEENGMFSKLFKLIFTHKGMTEYGGVNIPFLLSKGCKHLENYCPLTTLTLSPYTDI